ncbi:MAG: hypothetical protein A3F09_00705 [Chlamydiae bacterium RIFCSPHIGHO2_12_FULL_49_11]|nr:MAG: hypothetical protein A3F09_00705 [Chlamydiae bacterium RIFCSPHIGHO2_12_FULL_49_11]
MIPRELPLYLVTAYFCRYTDRPEAENIVAVICTVVKRFFGLIVQIMTEQPSESEFVKNRRLLFFAFCSIRGQENADKPICIYFVSKYDDNGAILGTQSVYYHFYKMGRLRSHFDVKPYLIQSQSEIKNAIDEVKERYPQREIRFVDIVAHGNETGLWIDGMEELIIRRGLFSDIGPAATILLDGCSTGKGSANIAQTIARHTQGRRVLAPERSLWFSKPQIVQQENGPHVVAAAHGFAIINAFSCRSFFFPSTG